MKPTTEEQHQEVWRIILRSELCRGMTRDRAWQYGCALWFTLVEKRWRECVAALTGGRQ